MLLHWIWLATRPNMNDWEKRMVLQHFQDPEDVFFADKEAYALVEGLSKDAVDALQDKNVKQAHAIIRDCTLKDIHICTLHDGAYPARLKNISDPPLVLYYKGNLPDMDNTPTIAVVGTRDATAYGLNAAKRLGGQIAKCGGIVVSGMAHGIDGSAISGALTAGGMVVGVLGTGADVVYPLRNRGLFADAQRYGCLISEFIPGTPPLKWNFPKRNRLISGLSNGVLVVEAPAKSGALITARQAAEQGRDVFVVPGNIDVTTCAGSNALLRDGAIAVANGWDIVSEYEALYPDVVHRFDRPVSGPGFTDDVMAAAAESEKPAGKVAQKGKSPAKKIVSDKNSEKIIIDNQSKQPYIDIQDRFAGLSQQERDIVAHICAEGCLVDDLIAMTALPTATVLSNLTMLEIKGVVQRLPGKRVALK